HLLPKELNAPSNGEDRGDAAGTLDKNPVMRARHSAAKILIRARRRRDQVFARARRSGWKAGHEEGLREASQLLEEIELWREEMLRDERRRREQLQSELADLVTDIVSNVLSRELKSDPETVFGLISDSLRRFSSPKTITLAVCRENLRTFVERKDELQELLSPATQLSLTTDEDLRDGEFHIHSDEGIVVGTADDIAASLGRAISDGERGDG
ncbi:MAG: FliH/SctL family protein, partial [Clostridia bacterium]